MATKTWTPTNYLTFEDDNYFIECGIIRLRRANSNNEWTPTSPYKTQTIFKYPVLTAQGIVELFGFWSEELLNDGFIDYQLSPDNGTTFYRYDTITSDWVNDSEWSTYLEIDEGLPAFPLEVDNKSILVRVRLRPNADLDQSPYLIATQLFFELEFEFWEDYLVSLKHYLEDNLLSNHIELFELSAAATTIDLTVPNGSTPGFGKVVSPITVYNLTSDPNKLTNLFISYSGDIVTFAPAQIGIIEINYCYQPPIFITTDEYFFPASPTALIIFSARLFHDENIRYYSTTKETRITDKLVRIREVPKFERFVTTFICQDYKKARVLRLCEGVDRVIKKGYSIDSEKTGEQFEVLDSPRKTVQNLDAENLKVIEMTVPFATRRWLEKKGGEYTEVPLVEEIILKIRANDSESIETIINVAE